METTQKHSVEVQCLTYSSGGSKGAQGMRTLLGVQILSLSCSFWKFWQNHMLAPPWELVPPPGRNPGSATVFTNWMETTQKHSVEANCLTSSQTGMETTQKHSVEAQCLTIHKLDGGNQKHSVEAQCLTSSQTACKQSRSTVLKPIFLLPNKLDGDNQKHSVGAKCLTSSQTEWRQSRSTLWKPSILIPNKEDGGNKLPQHWHVLFYCYFHYEVLFVTTVFF